MTKTLVRMDGGSHSELHGYLTDLISITAPFSASVANILLKRTAGGDLEALAQDKNAFIVIRATSKKPVELIQHPACLSSVEYLSSALSVVGTNMMKGKPPVFTINTGMASDRKTEAIKSIDIKSSRFTFSYNASDPFLNKTMMVKRTVLAEWPVQFVITSESGREFEDAARVHATGSRNAGDRDSVFKLTRTDSSLVAEFGEKSHRTQVVLSEAPKGDSKPFEAFFGIDLFRSMLKILGNDGGIAHLNPMALKIETETAINVYTITMTAKIVSRN